jgi:hypothetical protein
MGGSNVGIFSVDGNFPAETGSLVTGTTARQSAAQRIVL